MTLYNIIHILLHHGSSLASISILLFSCLLFRLELALIGFTF